MRRARWVVSAGTLAAALFTAAGSPAQAPDPLTVHVSLPFTGAHASFAEDIARGARLALEDAGGRAGDHAIRMAVHDAGDPDTGTWSADAVAANARRAAADPAAVAYLGEFSSGESAVSMPILNDAGILQISPSNSYTGLTRPEGACCGEPDRYFPTGRRHYARVAAPEHLQAAALVDYLRLRGVRRAALVHDGGEYGRELIRLVARRLPRGRVIAVARARLRDGGSNAAAIACRVARRRAGGLVFGGAAGDGAVRLWRAAHRRAPRLKLFAGEGVAEPAFLGRIPSSAARRTRLTRMHLAPWKYPPAAAVALSTLRDRHGRGASAWALYGYEAMRLSIDAIAQAGPRADIESLRAAAIQQVFATRDRLSVIGRYSIDELGDTTHPRFGGWRIRDGSLAWHRVLRTG